MDVKSKVIASKIPLLPEQAAGGAAKLTAGYLKNVISVKM